MQRSQNYHFFLTYSLFQYDCLDFTFECVTSWKELTVCFSCFGFWGFFCWKDGDDDLVSFLDFFMVLLGFWWFGVGLVFCYFFFLYWGWNLRCFFFFTKWGCHSEMQDRLMLSPSQQAEVIVSFAKRQNRKKNGWDKGEGCVWGK